MSLLRCLVVASALALFPLQAWAQTPAAQTATEPGLEQRQAARAEIIRRQIELRREQMRRNAAGEVRSLRAPLWDGYVLEFEHNLLFEDIREQAGFDVREYELALRMVEPRVALAELMQRLLDAGFTVEEPAGPPQARVLRFWREGRSMQDARFSVHVGERALSNPPSAAERGATGVLILRLYERRGD